MTNRNSESMEDPRGDRVTNPNDPLREREGGEPLPDRADDAGVGADDDDEFDDDDDDSEDDIEDGDDEAVS
jgi:hypothetical protein